MSIRAAYDPQVLKVLSSVFREVWSDIKERPFAKHSPEATRATIASALLHAAGDGDLDPERLRLVAHEAAQWFAVGTVLAPKRRY
jgi:hypothetical protein